MINSYSQVANGTKLIVMVPTDKEDSKKSNHGSVRNKAPYII
jgi:hypothetical protein